MSNSFPKENDLTNPGIENNKANIGINKVFLDFKKIKIMSIKTLVKKIIQNPNPKKAVHTNNDGLMKGQKAQRNDDKRAAIPQIPIIDFPNP